MNRILTLLLIIVLRGFAISYTTIWTVNTVFGLHAEMTFMNMFFVWVMWIVPSIQMVKPRPVPTIIVMPDKDNKGE